MPVGFGVLLPLPVTVAVKTIDCPVVAGLADDVNVVVDVAVLVEAFTICVSTGDEEDGKFESPL